MDSDCNTFAQKLGAQLSSLRSHASERRDLLLLLMSHTEKKDCGGVVALSGAGFREQASSRRKRRGQKYPLGT